MTLSTALVAALACLAFAALAAHGIDPPAAATCAAVTRPVDCGFANITAALCAARGCCFDASVSRRHRVHRQNVALSDAVWAAWDEMEAATPSCFYAGDGVDIKTVHVIQSNHFDAGYAELSVDILNEYFDTYFPRAYSLGRELRALGGEERLRWLTQPYVISLFLDCPLGYGLHCPNETAVANVKSAIQAGDITWQVCIRSPPV